MRNYSLRLMFTFGCIIWMFKLLGHVTNQFGVCYDTAKKTFEVDLELKRHIIVHDNGNVSNLDRGVHVTASNLTRLNKNYYLVNDLSGLYDHKKSSVVLFKYYLNWLDKENSMYFGCIELPNSQPKQMPIVEGDFLLLRGLVQNIHGSRNLQGSVIHNGQHFKAFLGGAPSILYLSDTDGYLFWKNSPFNLLTRTHYSYYESKLNEVKQTPFLLIFSVWNQVVYGIASDSENPLESYPCLYDLVTKKIRKLPSEMIYNENIVSILVVDSNEIITWSATDEGSMIQVIRDFNLNVKHVDYSYQREHNVLIKTFQDGRIQIFDSKEKPLVESSMKPMVVLKVDLDQNLDNQVEALICVKDAQKVLVDCINGIIHKADEIEHVGLVFFRLVNDGKEKWVTL